jgi:hypothetical protein
MTQAQQPHLEPIGYHRGRPIWPIMGGDGTDDGAGAGAGDGGTQAGGTSSGQAAAPEDGQAAAGSSSSSDEGTGGETAAQQLARLERENRELRNENATRRRAATAAEQAAEQARQAGLTAEQRTAERQAALEEENSTLRTQLREQALSTAALAAAAKLNFRNPELAVRLLDRGAVEWDDKGQPKGVEAQLAALAKGDPYLVKGTAAGDYGGGNRGQAPDGQPGMNELLSTVLRRQ